MRKGIRVLAVILSFLLVAAQAQAEKQKKQKIGYVDLYKVFNDYKKTKESEGALEEKAEKKNKEREKMVEAVKKLQEEAELLSENDKAEKEKDIEKKLKALRDFDTATRDELSRERDSQGRDIILEIGRGIEAYGRQNEFDLILDSRAIFYGSEAVDMTSDVIEEMNKKE